MVERVRNQSISRSRGPGERWLMRWPARLGTFDPPLPDDFGVHRSRQHFHADRTPPPAGIKATWNRRRNPQGHQQPKERRNEPSVHCSQYRRKDLRRQPAPLLNLRQFLGI